MSTSITELKVKKKFFYSNLFFFKSLKKKWKIQWKGYMFQEKSSIAKNQFSSVQLLSCVWLFVTPWIAARQASLSITNSRSLLKHMSIESVMSSKPSHPLSSPSPPSPNPSQHQGLFQWFSSSHQVAKVLEFQLHHQFFQWTFRTDFL